MPPRTPPPEQLDIPLVWDGREGRKDGTPDGTRGEPRPPAPATGAWRLWAAVLTDAGGLVLGVALALGTAAALGAELPPGQIVLAGLAGLEVASVVALGSLWGWRATPGMLLVGIRFSHAIPWGRAARLWVAWVSSMVLAGVPLLFRRRGESVAERLAGGSLSFRSLAEGA